ncbi:hypothetical protein AC1031_014017 [Aphanomyces cochlioides]|nr:hypothetical protein AC1031_014017 [Aphanomyces cochlioides]
MMQKLTHLFRGGSSKEDQLFQATIKADVKRIHTLVARGADVNYQDKDGRTPLTRAATIGHLYVTKVLLAYGADAELADEDGWSPLHLASSYGHWIVVDALLAHGVVVDGTHDETPLLIASINGHLDIVMKLLAHGADIELADKWTEAHCTWLPAADI